MVRSFCELDTKPITWLGFPQADFSIPAIRHFIFGYYLDVSDGPAETPAPSGISALYLFDMREISFDSLVPSILLGTLRP